MRRIETQGVDRAGPWMHADGRGNGGDARDMGGRPYFFGDHIGHTLEVGARYSKLGKLVKRHALKVAGA